MNCKDWRREKKSTRIAIEDMKSDKDAVEATKRNLKRHRKSTYIHAFGKWHRKSLL